MCGKTLAGVLYPVLFTSFVVSYLSFPTGCGSVLVVGYVEVRSLRVSGRGGVGGTWYAGSECPVFGFVLRRGTQVPSNGARHLKKRVSVL